MWAMRLTYLNVWFIMDGKFYTKIMLQTEKLLLFHVPLIPGGQYKFLITMLVQLFMTAIIKNNW